MCKGHKTNQKPVRWSTIDMQKDSITQSNILHKKRNNNSYSPFLTLFQVNQLRIRKFKIGFSKWEVDSKHYGHNIEVNFNKVMACIVSLLHRNIQKRTIFYNRCNGARAITYRDKFDKRIDKVQGNFLGGKHLSNGCEMTPRSNAKEGLRAESKHITPRSVKTRKALFWSKGLGVGNWPSLRIAFSPWESCFLSLGKTKTFLSLGIMMVRFPGLNWHRRAWCAVQLIWRFGCKLDLFQKLCQNIQTAKKEKKACQWKTNCVKALRVKLAIQKSTLLVLRLVDREIYLNCNLDIS